MAVAKVGRPPVADEDRAVKISVSISPKAVKALNKGMRKNKLGRSKAVSDAILTTYS